MEITVVVMAYDEAAHLAAADSAIRVAHHGANRGLGGVYRTGFAEARGDLVTFFPADGQFPASILGDFIRAAGGAKLVLGHVPDRRGRPLAARALSAAERLLYRALFGRLPRFQGILMFRRALLDRVTLTSEGRGWAVLLEFVIRSARAGRTVAHVATPLRPRAAGVSKVNDLRTIRSSLAQVLALRARL